MLYRRFCRFIQQEGLINPGENLVVGISGGPDSVCLGHLLKRWQRERGGQFIVAHLDHGLRKSAARDAEFTAELAKQWGWPCRVSRVEVKELAERLGDSLQAVAREERFKLFSKLLKKNKASKVALGHQADDQAETVLFWFLRGCGLKGMSGIRPLREFSWGTIIHPLLPFRRDEILSYLAEHVLSYRLDESNRQPKYLRNRLRLELMPQLREVYNPRLASHLINLAQQAAVLDDYLDKESAAVFAGLKTVKDDRGLSVTVTALGKVPPAILSRLWERLIEEAGGGLTELGSEHYHFLSNLLANEQAESVCLPGGLNVFREFDQLIFSRDSLKASPPSPQRLAEGGAVNFGEYRFALKRLKNLPSPGRRSADAYYLDGDKLHFPLTIRSFQPGDRLAADTGSSKKVKRYFNKERLPRSSRPLQPIVTSADTIICLPGIKCVRKFEAKKSTKTPWRLSWRRATARLVTKKGKKNPKNINNER